MPTPPVLEFWRNFNEGTILQCFFCLQLSLSKVAAKIHTFFNWQKKDDVIQKKPPAEYPAGGFTLIVNH